MNMNETNKRNEFPEPIKEWIAETWKLRSEGLMSHQAQILNWVFTVNLGGVAGTLTFLSTAQGSRICWAVSSLIAFSLGLLSLLAYGTIMFYVCASGYHRFRNIVDDYYSGKETLPSFWKKANEVPEKSKSAEIAAWLSGLLAVIGVVCAIKMI